MEKLVGAEFLEVGKSYKVIRNEFNCSIEIFRCKVVESYPNFYMISIDGKMDTVIKNKIRCHVYEFYIKQRGN